ncbi:bifunctional DNA primase/polymerase [Agromyces italicus]|uniref:bifunctional DNA primase/polymerase n=1 Tax=Agromyces italicus TaxID=279572 RepID=UPI0003B41D8D|nr:bifunctional DNA primase/polymerase [Agromyces italicus]
MEISQLLLTVTTMPPRRAAHAFARTGIPIFPCVPNGKQPMSAAGFHDASCDLETVDAWWGQHPDANIGLPTGHASGVNVVDVDIKAAGSGFVAFERAREVGLVDGELARVRTPSGGMHVYFPAPMFAEPQRCWQSATAHIDFRGDGGYVIVPPSALAVDGRRRSYRVSSLSTRASKPVDATRLRDYLDPRAAHPERGSSTPATTDTRHLANWVSRLQEGERNRGLYWAACRLVEAGFDVASATDALARAAQHAGLSEREAIRTIRSAARQPSTVHELPAAQWHDDQARPCREGGTPCLP